MIRRRKFLTFFKNQSYTILKINIIQDNLYYNSPIPFFSSNPRFFWKKINHLFKIFELFNIMNSFSKLYYIIKSFYLGFYFNIKSSLEFRSIFINFKKKIKIKNLYEKNKFLYKKSCENKNSIDLVTFLFLRSLTNYRSIIIQQKIINFVIRKKIFL